MYSALNKNKGRQVASHLSRTNLCSVKPPEISFYIISSTKKQVAFYFRPEKHMYFSLKVDIHTLNCRKKWVSVMGHQNYGSHGCWHQVRNKRIHVMTEKFETYILSTNIIFLRGDFRGLMSSEIRTQWILYPESCVSASWCQQGLLLELWLQERDRTIES